MLSGMHRGTPGGRGDTPTGVSIPDPIREKISRMEEVINFPAPYLSHSSHAWENGPMVPYSDLEAAALSLAERCHKVAIVTGFYIPMADPPAAETDGPPGAVILADGLRALGMNVILMSDRYALSTLIEGLKALGQSEEAIPVICFPMEHDSEDHPSRAINDPAASPVSRGFVDGFFGASPGADITHLLFIERVGPNHTTGSITGQECGTGTALADFESLVPEGLRDRCLNARAQDITRFTAKTHLLLEDRRIGRTVESIGIGDRGNEIGSGIIPWKVFRESSRTGREPLFCSRVRTDHFLSSGVSNWGAYALLASVALLRGAPEVLENVTPEREMEVLDHLIHHGPSVDGIMCRQNHSVDGIAFDDYVKIIERVKEIALI